ncbi:MAG: tetratricopeptide repeat protein [Myxococcales bacterium]|nr:tetratricopeptide repeat protein [Myxococcales bacterium]
MMHPKTTPMPALRRLGGAALLILFATLLSGFSLTDGAEEKAEFVEGLKKDIVKVDHSMTVTKELIRRSKGAPFLPDIIFRLAELYVEKSRLVYYLDVELKGEQAATSPEAKLLKNEAITVYRDVMHRFPEYRYNDKVLFFLGHEFAELGMYAPEEGKEPDLKNPDCLLAAYRKLVEEYPKSPLMLEALFIIGNYYFDNDKFDDAEKWYNRIFEFRESPIHDMARYKLGWIEINRARVDKKHYKKALQLFEQVATSQNTGDETTNVDTQKAMNIKQEALSGIVFCYTEVHSPKMALDYFKRLAPSKIGYVQALEKLANRYFIKEQYDNAALIYRRIIDLSNDVEKNLDYAQRIYDASGLSKSKDKVDEDVKAMVKAAAKYAYSWRIPDEEKAKLAKEYEVYARDIVTKLHLLAQKRQEKRAFRIAAAAYKNYLSFFDYTEKLEEVKYNYAESLFSSDQYLEAARAYEDIARNLPESKDRKDTVYSAIQSFQAALANAKYLSRFGLVEARQGLKQLGAFYVKKYTQDEKTPTIKFNVARMFYDQGEYKQAIESFLEYIKQYPTDKEVAVAGHLVLDCYKQLEDYKGLAQQGRAFVSDASITDQKFKQEMALIVEQAENRELDKQSLEAAKDGGDAAQKLLDYAGTVEGAQGENAIYRSFVMAKEKRNIDLAFRAGATLAQQFPQSKYLTDVYGTLGSFSAQMADFERAAALYEDFFNRFPTAPEAREAMYAAATFHGYLGKYAEAIKDYRALVEKETGERRARALVEVADAYSKMEDWRMVLETAQQAVAEMPSSVKGQLLLAKALESRGKTEEAKQAYMAAASVGGEGDEGSMAAEAQFRVGEMMLEDYRKIRFGAGQDDTTVLQQKAQTMQVLEQIFAGVVQMKDAVWAIAALYKLYEVYEDFAAFLSSAPIPAALSADQKKQYQAMLDEQTKTQRQTAKTFLDTCIKTVREKKVFGPYALACINKEPPVPEKVARRRSGARAQGPQVDALKAKLLKNPNDLSSLNELTVLNIASQDMHMAKLLASKALEINENHAPSLNLMGVISLHLGDDQDAYDFFKKAMDADGKLIPARLNMAAMFTKYKDEDRARAVLSPILAQAKTFDLSTPDIHPLVRDVLAELKIR